jgi:hypothetical protein
VEISPYVDAGYAWGGFGGPSGTGQAGDAFEEGIDRKPVVSTGLSARVNVLGYLIAEAYYAYPFQRPEKGAHFGFQLMPGW